MGRGAAIAASLVLASVGAAVLWSMARTSTRWLALAVLGTYLIPWAISCGWAPEHCRTIAIRFALSTAGIAAVWLSLEAAAIAGLVNYQALLRAPISEWWYGPPDNVVDPDLLYLHRPYLRLSGSQPGDLAAGLCQDGATYRYDVRYDRHGFRNEEDLAVADIAVVGDSFIEAPTIPTRLTVTAVLERLTGRTVANLGMSAYGPQQELVVLARYALALQPTVLVWAFYEGNDFKDMARYEGRRAQVQQEGRRRFRPEASLTRNALMALHRLLRGCVAPAAPGMPSGILPRAQPLRMHFIRPPSSPADDQLSALAGIFAEAEAMARRGSSRLIVLFIPTSFRVYHDLIDCRDCEGGADDLPERMRAMLRRVSPRIEYLDLTQPFRVAAREGELVYRPDDTHWTPAGHRVAAEAIGRLLTTDGHVARPGSRPD